MITLKQGEPWYAKGVWKGAKMIEDDGTVKRTANVSCPECGITASLSRHTIAADGKVTPSLVCPYGGCSFHDHVVLEGWTE